MPAPASLQRVEERLREAERRTGVRVVVAAVERADVYHGLRWRAFALGAAGGGAVVVGAAGLRPELLPAPASFWAVAAVLGAGLLLALAATLSPAVARLFLEPLRAEAEVRERAATLFLDHELFGTGSRTAVLLLASGFERLGVVRADRGLEALVRAEAWRAVEDAMNSHLRAGRVSEGLIAGLEELERRVAGRGSSPAGGAGDGLPDGPVIGVVHR